MKSCTKQSRTQTGVSLQCGQPSRPTAGDASAVPDLARMDGTAQIRPSRPSL